MSDQKVIFTITTGRSGTKYLANLFRVAKNAESFHEPLNEIQYLRQIQKTGDTSIAKKFVLDEKIKFIGMTVKNNDKVYIETSHLICKGYLEYLIEYYKNHKIIYLQRDIKNTAKSLYKHKSITQELINNSKARSYYRFPTDVICNFKLPLFVINSLSDFELCVWYIFEIHLIYEKLIKKKERIHVVQLENLNTVENVRDLFCELELEIEDEERLKKMIGIPMNIGKDDSFLDLTDEEMNDSIEKIKILYDEYYDNIR
jgi:hypothetical protein